MNFRLKPLSKPIHDQHQMLFITLMTVSYPLQLPNDVLIRSLQNRLQWAIDCQKTRQKTPAKKPIYFNHSNDLADLTLDSEMYFEGNKMSVRAIFERYLNVSDFANLDVACTLTGIFKHWLNEFITHRQHFWQHKVGKSAKKITPFAMKTRWGSCSTQTKTIRLSIWLAQFPPACTDYVLVHELCHLHEANHSPRFWQHVERVMPNYQLWHDTLKSAHR